MLTRTVNFYSYREMKRSVLIFVLICWAVSDIHAQSNEDLSFAIEEFVTHISDSGKNSRRIYFCIAYHPHDVQQTLPFRVNRLKCKYFFIEDLEKIKKHTDQFFTIESPIRHGDTVDFLFTNVSIIRRDGEYLVEAECRGLLPIVPDVRVINGPDGERTIQSRIIQVNKKGIFRKNEL